MKTMTNDGRVGRPAGADEALGEAARNTRDAGDRLDDMIEFVRLVHQVRRGQGSLTGDSER
jgi:hypothetical protein